MAVGRAIGGEEALPEALLSGVIGPALAAFPVDVIADADAIAVASSRIVVAEVTGASPEVLLALAQRGPASGRTILLAPRVAGAAEPESADIIRYPPAARAVRDAAQALEEALRAALTGDRAAVAEEAERLRVHVLGANRRRTLERIEAGTVPLNDPDDPVLGALCAAYDALGEWAAVVRLVECSPATTPDALPLAVVRPYVVALNRVDRGEEARKIIARRMLSDGDDGPLYAALGRIRKDRWQRATGDRARARELGRAISAYAEGFATRDDDYYPGVNALTLMFVGRRRAADIAALTEKVRASLRRGRNAGEHPWWYWATRVQVEVISCLASGKYDFTASNRALDGLLAQPSEEWMRTTTAQDLGRIAEAQRERNETPQEVASDAPEVCEILEIRQAVIHQARASLRGMPPHCVLEATRRGGDRWINFTSAEPRPIFCRGTTDDNTGSALPGDLIADLQEPRSGRDRRLIRDPEKRADRRVQIIEEIGSQLSQAFSLTESSIVDLVAESKVEYLVLQVDEETAIEPWELLAQTPGTFPSLQCSFARRLWLGDRTVRRRSPKRSRRALVIGNPTGDLAAAEEEAKAVARRLTGSRAFLPDKVETLLGPEATLGAVREVLTEGGIDLLHYAGHAQGGDVNGLVLADQELLPRHLSGWGLTPAIVVANACSSGEVGGAAKPGAAHRPSFVTALTEEGVGVFLGCAWPVGDAQAQHFSDRFYEELLGGATVGEATRTARVAVRDQFGEADPYWGAYVLYGNPWYRFADESVPERGG